MSPVRSNFCGVTYELENLFSGAGDGHGGGSCGHRRDFWNGSSH